jgi:hypothetical protein
MEEDVEPSVKTVQFVSVSLARIEYGRFTRSGPASSSGTPFEKVMKPIGGGARTKILYTLVALKPRELVARTAMC